MCFIFLKEIYKHILELRLSGPRVYKLLDHITHTEHKLGTVVWNLTVPFTFVEVHKLLTVEPIVVLSKPFIVSREVFDHDVIHKEFDELIDLYNTYWFLLCFFDPYFVLGSVWPDETYVRWVFENLLEKPRRHEPLWSLWTGYTRLCPLDRVQTPQRRPGGFLNAPWGGTNELPVGWAITRVLAGQVLPEVSRPVRVRREVFTTLGADPSHPLHWAGKIIGNPKTRPGGGVWDGVQDSTRLALFARMYALYAIWCRNHSRYASICGLKLRSF